MEILPNWTWYWDREEKELYRKYGEGYYKIANMNTGGRTPASQIGFCTNTWVPSDLIEAQLEQTTVTRDGDTYYAEGSHTIRVDHNNTSPPSHGSIRDKLQIAIVDLDNNKGAGKQA